MKILAVDVGTGTQDILLFDSSGPVENCTKMVMPSPTQIAADRIRRATEGRRPVVLTGVLQGGGPCHWALEDHLRAGLPAYATAQAARTFDDDLAEVERMGVRILGDDEAARVADAERVELRDIDLPAIRQALAAFDVDGAWDGVALGCLDHGAAPPGYSDRLFRFEHLRRLVERENDLRSFAMLRDELPDYLTRARTLLETANGQGADAPLVFLDTGTAAALGALQDPNVGRGESQLVMNLGNMHTLAFHLRATSVIGLFEHHTGEVTGEQIAGFASRLVEGTLRHEEIFNSKGHGAFYVAEGPPVARPAAAVTGPQRGKIRASDLDAYFAAPHGDMMISGCFGLVQAWGMKHPDARDEIEAALGVGGQRARV